MKNPFVKQAVEYGINTTRILNLAVARTSDADRPNEKHPGWHLLQVAKCPTSGCGKPVYCEEHQYTYRKWWVNCSIGLK
ncbi:hypothetical protein ACFLWX_04160 [Chloroflexota bacterium]